MLESEYKKNLEVFHNKIMELPVSDLKYHLYLLLVALNNDNSEYTRFILEGALEFTDSFHDFLLQKDEDEKIFIQLYVMNKAFETLIGLAGTDSQSVMMNQALLNICGSVNGMAFGLVGGFIGGVCGVTRGLWNRDVWKYSWASVVAGGFLGSAIGFRLPKKIVKDPLFRQLKYALDGLTEAFDRVQYKTSHTLDAFNIKAYEHLLEHYFDNDIAKFDEYLSQEEAMYEIGTWGAEFVSPVLAGSLGHHGFIRIPINDKYFGFDFTPSPSDFTKAPIQSEIRHVSGVKILEMFAFHLALQETDACDKSYILTTLKSGERDCVSYINKLLIGTSQKPTNIQRYHESDSYAGHALGFFMRNLTTFPDRLPSHVEDTNLSVDV